MISCRVYSWTSRCCSYRAFFISEASCSLRISLWNWFTLDDSYDIKLQRSGQWREAKERILDQVMNLPPMVSSGPRKGKKMETMEMKPFIIVVAGIILQMKDFTPPPRPKQPRMRLSSLVTMEKQVIGMAFIIFFPLFLIRSHRLFGSQIISSTSLGRYMEASTSLYKGTSSLRETIWLLCRISCISLTQVCINSANCSLVVTSRWQMNSLTSMELAMLGEMVLVFMMSLKEVYDRERGTEKEPSQGMICSSSFPYYFQSRWIIYRFCLRYSGVRNSMRMQVRYRSSFFFLANSPNIYIIFSYCRKKRCYIMMCGQLYEPSGEQPYPLRQPNPQEIQIPVQKLSRPVP